MLILIYILIDSFSISTMKVAKIYYYLVKLIKTFRIDTNSKLRLIFYKMNHSIYINIILPYLLFYLYVAHMLKQQNLLS